MSENTIDEQLEEAKEALHEQGESDDYKADARQAMLEDAKEELNELWGDLDKFLPEDAPFVLDPIINALAGIDTSVFDDPYLNAKKLKELCEDCNRSTTSELKKEVKQRRKKAKRKNKGERTGGGQFSRYFDNEMGGMSYHYFKEDADEPIEVPITNFKAHIVSQRLVDDGVSVTREFTIVAVDHREQEITTTVTSTELEKVSWVAEKLGAGCAVFVECSAARLREALQTRGIAFSEEDMIPEEYVYGHLGIREIDGELGFLHRGGFLTAESNKSDVLVDLDDAKLNSVEFSDPSEFEDEEVNEAVRDSMIAFIEAAPKRITIPLFCSVVSGPLCSIHPQTHTDFMLGPTGTLKTSLCGGGQAYYGKAFNGDFMLDSFASTPKQLERLLFVAKDMSVIVDECTSDGSFGDQKRINSAAEYLFRSHGNKNPRKRLQSDGKQNKNVYHSRCALGVTGESMPAVQESLIARMYPIPVGPRDVDKEKLTELQRLGREGILALCMARYIQWVLENYDGLKKRIPEIFEKRRSELAELSHIHTRTPSNIAEKLISYSVFLAFAKDIGAITDEEHKALRKEARATLVQGVEKTAEYQQSMSPAENFVRTLMDGLSSGAFHMLSANPEPVQSDDTNVERLRDVDGMPNNPRGFGWQPTGTYSPAWVAKGANIGWVDDDNKYELLLNPSAAYGEIRRHAVKAGRPLNIGTPADMWKRLNESGFITMSGNDRVAVQRTVPGGRRRVIPVCLQAVARFLDVDLIDIIGSEDSDDSDNEDMKEVFATHQKKSDDPKVH